MSGAKHRLYFSKRCRFCQAFLEELIRTPFVSEVLAICVDPSPTRPPLPPWLKSVPALVVAGESAPRIGPGDVNNWLAERRIFGAGGGGAPRSAADAMAARSMPLTPPVYNPDLAPRPDATARMPAPPRMSAPPSNTVSFGLSSGGGRTPAVTEGRVSAPAYSSSVPGVAVPSGGRMPAAISGSTPASSTDGPPRIAGSDDGPTAYHTAEMGGNKWSDMYSFVGHAGTAEHGYDPIGRNFESLVSIYGGAAGAAGGAASGRGAGGSGAKKSEKEEALLRDFEAYSAARDRDVAKPVARR
jgi:hypothetical protein